MALCFRSMRFLARVLIILFISSSLISNAGNVTLSVDGITQLGVQPTSSLVQNDTILQSFENASHMTIDDEGQFIDGWNLLALGVYPDYPNTTTVEGYMLVVDTSGKIVNGLYIPGGVPESPGFVNSTTVFFGEPDSGSVMLWNLETNDTRLLPVPQGHDDITYNPFEKTFLIIERVKIGEFDFEGEILPIWSDDVVEYHVTGVERWRWRVNASFPFDEDEFYLRNETIDEGLDWTHANSIYWDLDNNEIYLNVRNLDCIVKINRNLGTPVWSVGRYNGLTTPLEMYDDNGNSVTSLFFDASDLELVGGDRFLVYGRASNDGGNARAIEFTVDEVANSANEVWRYDPPSDRPIEGLVERLPNGNTVWMASAEVNPVLVEVNAEGEIIWKWTINATDDFAWTVPVGGAVRFYPDLVVASLSYMSTITEGEKLVMAFSVWDTFHRPYRSEIQVILVESGLTLVEETFALLPFWQQNDVVIEITSLTAGEHVLAFIIQNEDEVTHVMLIEIIVEVNLIVIGGLGIGILAIVVSGLLLYKRNSQVT